VIDDELTDELRAMLADPATWVEPPPDLEDRVVGAVVADANQTSGNVSTLADARRRRSRWWLGAVAASAIVVVAVASVAVTRGDSHSGPFEAALTPTELASSASGTAVLDRTDSGWSIYLDTTGLPRLDDGWFYQAWQQTNDGTLVPVGTFNEGSDVTLWAGVGPLTFPIFVITEEAADGNQDSSGRVVLTGPILATP